VTEAIDAELAEALSHVVDPELGTDVVTLGMIRAAVREGSTVRVELALTIAACPLRSQLQGDVERALRHVPGIESVEITTVAMDREERAALMSIARREAQQRPIRSSVPPTARVLAVVSGKGGVGKSSVAVNLAVSLARRGARVGLLDADIWGFSVPRLLGLDDKLEVRAGKMLPIELPLDDGLLKVVSMGFLSGEDEAIMWRGLVLNRAVQHFLEDVAWGALDYLVVDLPPGTGDVQMGLARMLPHSELLLVTTPALAAQKVAGRAADMARRGHLRVAGVIENMSSFVCDHGEEYALFGSGGGERLAEEIGVPLIGQIPIDAAVAAGGDEGRPVALDSTSPSGAVFAAIAELIATEIAPAVEMSNCSAILFGLAREAVSAPS